jgi:hypothetical protein
MRKKRRPFYDVGIGRNLIANAEEAWPI